jgi:hypothetical protein
MCEPAFVRTSFAILPLAIAYLLTACLPSCKASVKTEVNAGAKTKKTGFEELEDMQNLNQAPALPESSAQTETEYFGIARRMSLQAGVQEANCQCVAGVVGFGNEPFFQWFGEKPFIGSDALVVAISAEGIPCEQKGRGPSIAAIDRDGQDVVVVLEEFKDTRPIARGAIIPNPGSGGSVYLRARGKAPYGRPFPGQGTRGLCKIGNGNP